VRSGNVRISETLTEYECLRVWDRGFGELESETLNKVSFMSNDHSLPLCLSPISMSLSPCVNQMAELKKVGGEIKYDTASVVRNLE
jgi:hypothetical protein